jgi:branched-chain amino acid aminotransferase
MSFEQTKFVWMNGEVVAWDRATLHVSAHALHYGSGVFEGVRCYQTPDGPAIFRLDAHLDRLYASANIYGIEIPYSQEDLEQSTCEVILRNNFSSCYIRPICFFGSDTLGLHPRRCPVEVAILAWPWAPYLGATGLQVGVRATISPWLKFHSRMMPTKAKACGQYLNSILAIREAVTRGYDEALLLDAEGHIAEGTGENLFIVKDGHVLTNDADHSILPGITRDCVIQFARELGYPVETGALHLEDLLAADEAFFTGTATEVAPIREVDDKLIGDGAPGPITTRIQEVFFAAVAGREDKYRNWLTFIKERAAVLV